MKNSNVIDSHVIGLANDALVYLDDSGELVRLVSSGGVSWGDVAGYSDRHGYRRVTINGKSYSATRIMYAMFHGQISCDLEVDHINGDFNDNRISNLRLLSHKENGQNRTSLNKNNKSGIHGVHMNKAGKWIAQISLSENGKKRKVKGLGTYSCPEDARAAFELARSHMYVS